MEQDSVQSLARKLEAKLGERGVRGRVVPANLKQIVADAPPKFLLRDASDRTTGFVLCSSRLAPDLIGRGARRAAEAREALGPELGEVVLLPTHVALVDGLSFALLPYANPISNTRIFRYFQRRGLRPSLFQWLREATAKTLSQPTREELSTAFEAPLYRIAEQPFARGLSNHALSALKSDKWRPTFALAHNDLWIGNVLHAPVESRWPFVIIDWLGSAVRGFAIFDLIRLAQSSGLSFKDLSLEIDAHCAVLRCSRDQAQFYLLAALGHVAMNLEQFPADRFRAMAESCWRTFISACAL